MIRAGASSRVARCSRGFEHFPHPAVDAGVDHEVHAIGRAKIRDAVGITQSKVPAFAFREHDSFVVEDKLDLGICSYRNMESNLPALECQLVIPVFLDDRAGCEFHQAHRFERAVEAREQ